MQARICTHFVTVVTTAALITAGCAAANSQDSGLEYGGIKHLAVHWVQSVSDKGRKVTLEDGSVWIVSPFSTTSSSRWQPGEQVAVRERGSLRYPYELVAGSNIRAGGSVQTTFAGYAPRSGDTSATR